VSECNGCKLKCEFTESRKSANQLRRCAIADTLPACARPAQQSHLRLSMVENRSRRPPSPLWMQRPRGPKSRGPATACAVAPSRHRSRPLSQTMCRLAKAPPAPFIDGRKSVASRAHTNMRATTEGAEILRSGKRLPRRAIALGHSPRPCAGSRKHRRPRFAMVENWSRRAPTPICVQRPRGPKS